MLSTDDGRKHSHITYDDGASDQHRLDPLHSIALQTVMQRVAARGSHSQSGIKAFVTLTRWTELSSCLDPVRTISI